VGLLPDHHTAIFITYSSVLLHLKAGFSQIARKQPTNTDWTILHLLVSLQKQASPENRGQKSTDAVQRHSRA
jgi:hypothetical protein